MLALRRATPLLRSLRGAQPSSAAPLRGRGGRIASSCATSPRLPEAGAPASGTDHLGPLGVLDFLGVSDGVAAKGAKKSKGAKKAKGTKKAKAAKKAKKGGGKKSGVASFEPSVASFEPSVSSSAGVALPESPEAAAGTAGNKSVTQGKKKNAKGVLPLEASKGTTGAAGQSSSNGIGLVSKDDSLFAMSGVGGSSVAAGNKSVTQGKKNTKGVSPLEASKGTTGAAGQSSANESRVVSKDVAKCAKKKTNNNGVLALLAPAEEPRESPKAPRRTVVATYESAEATKERVKKEEIARREELIASLPDPAPPSTIFVNTEDLMRRALADLSICNVFGLDTEMIPGHKPVLLQIAGMRLEDPLSYTPPSPPPRGDSSVAAKSTVYIFDLLALLPKHGAAFSQSFGPLLYSTQTVFLGVGIELDLLRLANCYGACVPCFAAPLRGILELGVVCGDEQGTKRSLRVVAAQFAGIKLKDSPGNWMQRPLLQKQLNYAANDARAALMAYAGGGCKVFTGLEPVLCVGLQEVWVCLGCQAKSLDLHHSNCNCRITGRGQGKMGHRNCVRVPLPVFGEEVFNLKLERSARLVAARALPWSSLRGTLEAVRHCVLYVRSVFKKI